MLNNVCFLAGTERIVGGRADSCHYSLFQAGSTTDLKEHDPMWATLDWTENQ